MAEKAIRMMDTEETSMPAMATVKEETRSLSSKKSVDKVDIKAKLERSRQSSRECRARKKLRYQYLEEIICEKEKSIFALRREMKMMKIWAKEMEEGRLPENLVKYRKSCVEKKLTSSFKLQQHQHLQIAQPRQQAAEVTAAGQFSQSPSSASALGSGGGCISQSSSFSMSLGSGMAAVSDDFGRPGLGADPFLSSKMALVNTRVNSFGRQQYQPNMTPEYTGYVPRFQTILGHTYSPACNRPFANH